ncbi:MAG: hypothetical protein AMJ67_10025 [Betaproteobacteria bacterium SG8_41]|nr:MAG: hypothetical protein AMJ67_10025 [Betaproteobacteria bacterium SG8_41]
MTGRNTQSMMRKTFAAARGARKEELVMNQEKHRAQYPAWNAGTRYCSVALRDLRQRTAQPSTAAFDYTSGNKHKSE